MTSAPVSLLSAAESCEASQFADLLCTCAQRNAVAMLAHYFEPPDNVCQLRQALCAAAMSGKAIYRWPLPFDTDHWITATSLVDKESVCSVIDLLRSTVFGDADSARISIAQDADVAPDVFVFSWPSASAEIIGLQRTRESEPLLLELQGNASGAVVQKQQGPLEDVQRGSSTRRANATIRIENGKQGGEQSGEKNSEQSGDQSDLVFF